MPLLAVLFTVVRPQTPDLFHRVLQQATGRNGYEQFVRAAQVVEGPEFIEYERETHSLDMNRPQTRTEGTDGS